MTSLSRNQSTHQSPTSLLRQEGVTLRILGHHHIIQGICLRSNRYHQQRSIFHITVHTKGIKGSIPGRLAELLAGQAFESGKMQRASCSEWLQFRLAFLSSTLRIFIHMNPLNYHASGCLRPIARDAVPTNIIGVRGQDGAHAHQNHLPGKLSGIVGASQS